MRFAAALLVAASCVADEGEPPLTECDEAPVTTWDNFASGFLAQNCQGCHASTSPARNGAPKSVSFDTEEEALGLADRIRATAVPVGGAMPPGGGVSDDDRYRLGVWLDCG